MIDDVLFAEADWRVWMFLIVVFVIVVCAGLVALAFKLYRRVDQGYALVVNGLGGTRVSFSGMLVYPVVHKMELMDIQIKRVEIYRHGVEGLICKDNIRADIKVVFFVRVNKSDQDVRKVAELLGCRRASEQAAIVELFDAKFSEALKTVGKRFDFVDLYNSRETFKDEILSIIGTDLNGYVLDDAAIDYLEQTPVEKLNPDNILDAEGIKKITDLTAKQTVLANDIRREKEKTLKKQDVEAKEAILELERQQAEAEQKQHREIAEVTSREQAEAAIVSEQQRQRSEQARIAAEEEILIAEENKLRQIIVAAKAKERTDKVEAERVEKDRLLEVTERDRIVTLAEIEKEKAVEEEKKNIQDVIRDRVMVERAVVEEEEKIKDTQEFAAADRAKQVAITNAERTAQESLIQKVKAAEAAKESESLNAEQLLIMAGAERDAAEKQTAAKKMLAEAVTAEAAAEGLAEAQVKEAQALALEKHGMAEAKVLELKFAADAEGITQKAAAMKLFDGVGREHEEFKLRLEKQKEIELAAITAQENIAAEQANIVGQALKSARIDIVGGDTNFFDKIVNSVSNGKSIDRMVNNSTVLTDVAQTFFNGNPEYFEEKLLEFTTRFSLNTDDIKNLSIAALLTRMISQANDNGEKQELQQLLDMANKTGIASSIVSSLKLVAPAS